MGQRGIQRKMMDYDDECVNWEHIRYLATWEIWTPGRRPRRLRGEENRNFEDLSR